MNNKIGDKLELNEYQKLKFERLNWSTKITAWKTKTWLKEITPKH